MSLLFVLLVAFVSGQFTVEHILDTPSTTTTAYGRAEHCAGRLGNKALFAGGYNDVDNLDDVVVFNVDTGAQEASLTLTDSRSYDICCTSAEGADGVGYFFVGGGRDTSSSLITSGSVDVFDTNGNQQNITLSEARYDLGCGWDGGELVYFFGGYNGTQTVDTVDVFNITSWDWLPAGTIALPYAQSGYMYSTYANGVFALAIDSADELYWIDDITAGFQNTTWPDGAQLADTITMAAVGDNIYIIGGYDYNLGSGENSNATRIFDTNTKTFSLGTEQPLPAGSSLPYSGSEYPQLVSVGGYIIITGGYNQGYYDTRIDYFYNTADDTWTYSETGISARNLYDGETGPNFVAFPDLGKAVIYGGYFDDDDHYYSEYAGYTYYNRHFTVFTLDACPVGKYGPQCELDCACSGQACDFTDGTCVCDAGSYGADCSGTCNCAANGACNDGVAGDGVCTCEAGWFDANCSSQCDCGQGYCDDGADGDGSCLCPLDKWGADCGSNCTCDITHGTCDVATGTCSRCDRDYYGADCDTQCPCQNGGLCDDTGACTCADGFFGSTCASACDCNTGECNDGAAADGSCTCAPGTYGTDCGSTCPTCSGHGACDDGSSGDGSCSCDEGYYGNNCQNVCDCKNGATCNVNAAGTAHTCTCPALFFGADCGGKCNCNGTCAQGNTGDGACTDCPTDFYGFNCQNLCDCQWFENCNDDIDGDGFCDEGSSLIPSFVVFVVLSVVAHFSS